jgi:hypothetical protein
MPRVFLPIEGENVQRVRRRLTEIQRLLNVNEKSTKQNFEREVRNR